MKLCIDCKHFEAWPHPSTENIDKCVHPRVVTVDLIRGQHKKSYAELVRKNHNACGVEARLWEPRDDTLFVSEDQRHEEYGDHV